MREPTKPYVIAEVGNCHEGSLDAAIELVERAREAGADFVKFQAGTAAGFARTREEIPRYEKYAFTKDQYWKLAKHAVALEIEPFFSVWGEGFDEFMVTPIRWRKIPARQCDSVSITRWLSRSTFISIPHWYIEVDVKALGTDRGIPMHCVTEYPAVDPMLNRILKLSEWLNLPAGFSDHTIGIENAIAAVKHAGAVAIEKHFTLSHDFGPLRDHGLAATPAEMRALVEAVKG